MSDAYNDSVLDKSCRTYTLSNCDLEYSTLLEVVEHLLIVVGDRLLFMEEQYQYTALHLLARVNRICVYILCLCSLITGEDRSS